MKRNVKNIVEIRTFLFQKDEPRDGESTMYLKLNLRYTTAGGPILRTWSEIKLYFNLNIRKNVHLHCHVYIEYLIP